MKKYFVGIDQGTTGVTVILFDRKWNQVSRGYCEEQLFYPRNGWVEHDPEDVWKSVCKALDEALKKINADKQEIISIGIDHEGESVVIWDKDTGKAVYPVIVWQDRRMAHYCDSIRSQYEPMIKEKTYLQLDSYFSATKLKWILDYADKDRTLAKSGKLLAGTMDVWLVWKMTAGKCHKTDSSTASRTMLYNIHEKDWDNDLLTLFQIPRILMPEICSSHQQFCVTDPNAFLGLKVPVTGILVDQQAALLGQACVYPGRVKTTYGTGCFMLMNTGSKIISSQNGLLSTVAWRDYEDDVYALDGGIYIAGAAIEWLRNKLQLIASAKETSAIAESIDNTNGLYFVPAFTGLAAPYWDSYARGMMIGITGNTSKADIVRATLEAIAYQVKDVLTVMEKDSDTNITVMRCDGGVSNNDFLMQFQADILGIPVEVPIVKDTTALGAAFMAAVGIGEYEQLNCISDTWKLAKRYEPTISEDQQDYLMRQWHRALERSRSWNQV